MNRDNGWLRIASEELDAVQNYAEEYRRFLSDAKTERLIDLCEQVQASEYISGPAAKDYIVEELFREANIKLTWMDYSGYGEYGQLFPPFNHFVSIIDLIFNEGRDSTKYMKTFNHA